MKVLPIIFSSSSESDGGISYFVQLLATVLFPYSPESVFFTVSETLAEAAPPEFASNENGFSSSSTGSCFSISKMCHLSYFFYIEKILKGSLDLIPSPSVKIQIAGKKVSLWQKGKTLLGIVNKLLKTKSLLSSPSNVLPYYIPQVNFAAHNLNFH